MAKLDNGTWIVVADGEKALFLRNLTDQQDPNFEVTGVEQQDNPPTGAQVSDQPGRMRDAGPAQKSAMDEADWHMLAKDRFARELSDILYKAAHDGAFEKLVLVASPHILGVLRDEMHQEVIDRIIADIPKTLTNHPVREIEDIVKTALDAA